MNKGKKPIALLDLDGTLADFDGAMRRDLRALMGPGEPELLAAEDEDDHPHIKARRDLVKRQPDWWFNLEPIPTGFVVVDMLRVLGFKLNVLSAGPKRIPGAWEQKVRWCLKHIPDAQITLTRDKSTAYGRVLVDDWVPYVEPWLKHRPRGLVLMPERPWNSGFMHPQVVRYADDLTEAQTRLLDALAMEAA